MNSNKFEWTPKRVQEFTAIYAGNFTGNKRFSRSDFIGLIKNKAPQGSFLD